MGDFKDTLPVVFGPIGVIAVNRTYTVLDPVFSSQPIDCSLLMSPTHYVPLACSIYTVASAILAFRANRLLAEQDPKLTSSSVIAFLAYGSAACIAVMALLAVRIETIGKWMVFYGALCAINAAWNYYATSGQAREGHMTINLLIAAFLFLWIGLRKPITIPHDLELIQVVLVAIALLTLIKRIFFKRFAS